MTAQNAHFSCLEQLCNSTLTFCNICIHIQCLTTSVMYLLIDSNNQHQQIPLWMLQVADQAPWWSACSCKQMSAPELVHLIDAACMLYAEQVLQQDADQQMAACIMRIMQPLSQWWLDHCNASLAKVHEHVFIHLSASKSHGGLNIIGCRFYM